MPEHHLRLLKSLALRPTRSIAVNLTPIVSALQVAGYVTLGPEGWAATAVGCATIEQSRTEGTMARSQNTVAMTATLTQFPAIGSTTRSSVIRLSRRWVQG